MFRERRTSLGSEVIAFVGSKEVVLTFEFGAFTVHLCPCLNNYESSGKGFGSTTLSLLAESLVLQ